MISLKTAQYGRTPGLLPLMKSALLDLNASN